jgi:hypothetical protein
MITNEGGGEVVSYITRLGGGGEERNEYMALVGKAERTNRLGIPRLR